MKKTELQAGIEYAAYASKSRWKAKRVKFTAEQIEKAKRGEIVAAVYEKSWTSQDWYWVNRTIQLNQIQESWEEFTQEEERQRVLRDENWKSAERARQIREAQIEELQKYLEQNGARLQNILGTHYSRNWQKPEIEIRLNREQIEALLERIG